MAKPIAGIDKLRTGIAVTLAATRQAIGGSTQRAASELAQQIKAECPERTGALKATIKVVEKQFPKGAFEVWIGNKSVDYAAHVEYGTSRMAAQSFVRPAVERFRKRFAGEIEQAIAQTWSGK